MKKFIANRALISVGLAMIIAGLIVLPRARVSLMRSNFFPIRKAASDYGISKFEAESYSKHLLKMGEPSLFKASSDARVRVYRLTILPTYGNAIAVRATKHGNSYLLSSRRLNGQSGFEVGTLAEKADVMLSEADSESLEKLLSTVRPFEMLPKDDVLASDADRWVFEGVAQGRYCIFSRCCLFMEEPKARGLEAFLALCTFLIEKSGLSQGPRNGEDELIPRQKAGTGNR